MVTINGGSTTNLVGAQYYPSTNLQITGGTTGTGCAELVASTITFSGNSLTGCVGQGTQTVTAGGGSGGAVALVE
jgi:hypothetical protein